MITAMKENAANVPVLLINQYGAKISIFREPSARHTILMVKFSSRLLTSYNRIRTI